VRNELRQVERLRGMKCFPGGEKQFVGNTMTPGNQCKSRRMFNELEAWRGSLVPHESAAKPVHGRSNRVCTTHSVPTVHPDHATYTVLATRTFRNLVTIF